MDLHATTAGRQRSARIFGWFFIGTFITSIPARILIVGGLGASWSNVRFVPHATDVTHLKIGAFLDFGVILTNVATAVVLYPIAKQHNRTLAMGYVGARIMESAFIAVGVLSVLGVASVHDAMAGAGGAKATALAASGSTLTQLYEWAFQFGPGLVVGFGNGLILGYLMYRSELVPPRMALFGLIGGPLLILSCLLITFGVYKNGAGPSGLLALPEIIWEVFISVYCAWKGFRTTGPNAEPVTAVA